MWHLCRRQSIKRLGGVAYLQRLPYWQVLREWSHRLHYLCCWEVHRHSSTVSVWFVCRWLHLCLWCLLMYSLSYVQVLRRKGGHCLHRLRNWFLQQCSWSRIVHSMCEGYLRTRCGYCNLLYLSRRTGIYCSRVDIMHYLQHRQILVQSWRLGVLQLS